MVRKRENFARRCTLAAIAACALGAAANGAIVHKVAVLTPDQENPPTASGAFGCGVFIIDTDLNTIDFRIAFTGLVAPETAAHIHGAADPGMNAGVIVGLPAGNPKVGTVGYPEAQEGDILDGKSYVNIHSAAFPGGEIRGQIVDLVATLDGGQENPPNASPARGFGLFQIDTTTNTLSYYIAHNLGALETAAHIHGVAGIGQNAGVMHPLPAGNPKVGAWNYPEAQENNILRGMMYVNSHTAAFPGGEIRGQVTPIVFPIDGRQEVPANGSTGAGCGFVSMDEANDRLGYDIRSGGLTAPETAAHIHGYAPPGVNAGVVHPLPAGARKLGAWLYPAGNEVDILAGRTYANIHTAAFPGGEIRGQILFPPLPPPPCAEDLNGDGMVNGADLAILLGGWGPCAGCPGDLDGDGDIDGADLATLLGAWGPC